MTNLKIDFETAFSQVQKETARVLTKGPKLVSDYTSYLANATGKMMRAKAVLACSMDKEGLVAKDAVYFAAAVEILHLATLVHDDIMDDAETRRGQITLHRKAGERTAVICGDYLLAAAIRELTQATQDDKYKSFDFSKYVQSIAIGELRQTINNKNFRLNDYRYFTIIDGKTAALFEASYHAGSLAGDNDQKRVNLFKKLGRFTGIIFQLTDDCIDYENTEETALKPVLSDYENGVITLPLIHAFEEAPELIDKAEAGLLSKEQIIEQVKAHDGVGYTHKVAEKFYKKGLGILKSLDLTGRQEEILAGLLQKAYVGLKG